MPVYQKDKVTIYQVSEACGYSIATVNRALNGKARISEETRQKIIKIADEMGFHVNKAARALAQKPVRIGVILSSPIEDFSKDIENGMKKALDELGDLGLSLEIHSIDTKRPDYSSLYMNTLDKLVSRGCSGIILLPNDAHGLTGQRIDQLYEQGILTATVVTDLPESRRVLCVRSDGICGGSLAAELLSMIHPNGKTAIFSSNEKVLINRENLQGFQTMAKENNLSVEVVYENNDEPELAYRTVDRLVAEHPDVDSIYITSANSISVCQRLSELQLEGRYTVVATDLFPKLTEKLKCGVIQATLFQDPQRQGNLAVKMLWEMINRDREQGEKVLITPQIVLHSNCDSFV